MGKSTISAGLFSIAMLVITRGYIHGNPWKEMDMFYVGKNMDLTRQFQPIGMVSVMSG